LRAAQPVANYLRLCLGNFVQRTFTVGDQVRTAHDLLGVRSRGARAGTG
jgi:hypothetical protein